MIALLATMAVVATLPATNVTNTTATLNGTDDTAATTHFEYGTSASYGLTTPDVSVTGGAAHANVTGLSPNTTYHFKVAGGQDATFQTAANPTAPGITNQHSSAVTTAGAHLSASLDPNGAETTYYFQYGRSTGYGNRSARVVVPAGADPIAVAADLTGLNPYTRYHWRLYATNAAGKTPGRDHTFRTGRAASAVSLSASRAIVSYGRGVTLGGRVTGAGVKSMTLALEQQRFPFATGFTPVRTTHAGSDGGFLFSVDHVWGLTRYRVVTQTQTPLTSAETTVRSAPRATIGARVLSRKRAGRSGANSPRSGRANVSTPPANGKTGERCNALF